jgi:hypothetical protein
MMGARLRTFAPLGDRSREALVPADNSDRRLQRPRWHRVVPSQARSIISHSPGGVRPLLTGAPGLTHITSCHPPSGS